MHSEVTLVEHSVDARDEAHVIAVLIDLDDFFVSCAKQGPRAGQQRLSALRGPIRRLAAEEGAAKCIEVPPDEWLIKFEGNDDIAIADRAAKTASAILAIARRQQRGGVTISVSRPFIGTAAERQAVGDARELIRYKILLGGDQVISRPPDIGAHADISDDTVRMLVDSARRGQQKELMHLLLRVAAKIPPSHLPGTLSGLFLTAMDSGYGPLREDGGTNWLALADHLAQIRFDELNSIHEYSNLSMWVQRAVMETFSLEPYSVVGVVRRAELFLLNNYSDARLTLTSVAQLIGVSPYYLAHQFNKERGTTFRRTLLAIRMRAASKLLADTAVPIHATAERSGFTDIKQFRRAFKQAFGCPPSEYRAKSRFTPPPPLAAPEFDLPHPAR